MSETLGVVVQKARWKRDMSQRELAKELGINFTYLSKIENDNTNYPPKDWLIEKLANFCDRSHREMCSLAGRISEEDREIYVELYKTYGDRFTELLKKMHSDRFFAVVILQQLK